jgi:hypothetical protein
VESHQEATTGNGGDAEESATVKERSGHEVSSGIGFRLGEKLDQADAIVTLK